MTNLSSILCSSSAALTNIPISSMEESLINKDYEKDVMVPLNSSFIYAKAINVPAERHINLKRL